MIYLDLMENRHHFHTAVQEGNFDGRMCAWEFFLPFYFSINKHNYARYGSWYEHQVRNRDSQHSDHLLCSIATEIQPPNRCWLARRTITEQGCQNCGRCRRFSAGNDTVTKGTMGRADQARNLNSLLKKCNIRQQYNGCKHIRPSQILKSESRTSNIVAVLENDYVNPFDIALDRTMLIKLSSRSEMETPSKLLSLQQDGITLAKEFLQKRLL